MDFADNFPDATLMEALGDTIIFIAKQGVSQATKGIIELDVERVGGDGYTVERVSEVELLKEDLAVIPDRGDFVVYKGNQYTLAALLSDDGHYMRFAIK